MRTTPRSWALTAQVVARWAPGRNTANTKTRSRYLSLAQPKARPRPPWLPPVSRHQMPLYVAGHVATPKACRHPKLPSPPATLNLRSPSLRPASIATQNLCRDTKLSNPVVPVSRHQIQVATPLDCYPCRDMRFMSRPGTNWSQPQPCRDTKLDVATWEPRRTRSRTCTTLLPALPLAFASACAQLLDRARRPCAKPAPACHDPISGSRPNA